TLATWRGARGARPDGWHVHAAGPALIAPVVCSAAAQLALAREADANLAQTVARAAAVDRDHLRLQTGVGADELVGDLLRTDEKRRPGRPKPRRDRELLVK